VRAIPRTRFGGPEVLAIREIPEPEPKDGHAVIAVKALGLNHAGLHLRKGEWAEIADVSGIEFVGRFLTASGDTRTVVDGPQAHYFGAVLDERGLNPRDNPRVGPTRFKDWLGRSVSRG
jgi:NADPH:quinone reductase-like Zn-dependent oxidoreductase